MTIEKLRKEIMKRMEEVSKGEPSAIKTERLLTLHEVLMLIGRKG